MNTPYAGALVVDIDAARGAGAADTDVGNIAEAAAGPISTETALIKPSIMIRFPQDGDWGALYALVRKVHERSIFPTFRFPIGSLLPWRVMLGLSNWTMPAGCRERRTSCRFAAGEYLLGEANAAR